MDFYKSLTLFNLKPNYTESELRKRYYEMIKKVHPDYHMTENIEDYKKKSQKINEAYEILKNNLKSRNNPLQNNQEDTWDNVFKISKIKQIINSYYVPCNSKILMNMVFNLISLYDKKINNTINIDEILEEFKQSLELLYKNYINLYAQEHNIPSFIIENFQFNYNSNCSNLYSQLKSSEEQLEIDIKNILEKFKGKENYLLLEEKIIKALHKTKNNLSYETTKEEYQQTLESYSNIVNNIINNYNRKYNHVILFFEHITPQLNYEIIQELYKRAKIIALELDNINSKAIYNAILKQLAIINNSKKRDEIFNELRKKYLNAPNQKLDKENAKLFLTASSLLMLEQCPHQILEYISKITFTNPLKELEKLIIVSEEVTSSEEEVLYLRLINKPSILFAKITKNQNNKKSYYTVRNEKNIIKNIGISEFRRTHIRLEKFVEESSFLGYQSRKEPIIQLLYYNIDTGIILGHKNNHYQIFDDSILKKTYLEQNKELKKYLDKKYLIKEISNSLNQNNNLKANQKTNKVRR